MAPGIPPSLHRRPGTWVGLVVLFIGSCVLWISASPIVGAAWRVSWPRATASITAAVVTRDRVGFREAPGFRRRGHIDPVYAERTHASYTFSVDGRLHRGWLVTTHRLTDGQAIAVQYNPQDPSDNTAVLPIRWDYWAGTGAGLILVGLGLAWPLVRSRRGIARA